MAHDAFGLCALRWGGPIGWEVASLDVTVKAGVGPSGGSLDQAMLHRVVMDVVDVIAVVGVVPDQVLPIPALPDAAFATPMPCGRSMFGGWDLFGEGFLDPPPAAGEVAVTGRERRDAVQVLRKNHPCIDPEASPTRSVDDGVLEEIQFSDEQIVAPPFEQVHREEVGAAWNPQASVIGHVVGT
jgi:hypothetical protein